MRALSLLLCSTIVFGALAAPAYADDAWGDDITVMADDEMSGLRGGLAVAPGLNVDFGAVVRTISNGVPVLETALSWTDSGAVVAQTVSTLDDHWSKLPPEALEAMGIAPGAGAVGAVINDENGATTLVHNVTDGALQNILINSANGRDITQQIEVTLTLPGFEMIQDVLTLERLGMHLADDLAGARFGG